MSSALLSVQRPQVSIRKQRMLTGTSREPKRLRREPQRRCFFVSSWKRCFASNVNEKKTDFSIASNAPLTRRRFLPRLLIFLFSRKEDTRSIRLRVLYWQTRFSKLAQTSFEVRARHLANISTLPSAFPQPLKTPLFTTTSKTNRQPHDDAPRFRFSIPAADPHRAHLGLCRRGRAARRRTGRRRGRSRASSSKEESGDGDDDAKGGRAGDFFVVAFFFSVL